MANERIVKGRTKKDIPLVVSDGTIEQKPYKDAGISAVNFGTKTITNTIPGKTAQAVMLPEFGRRTKANFGTQFERMLGNTRALMGHAASQGKTEEWSHFYENAHNYADELASKHNLSHVQASGIIASMSGGGGEWEKNKANARDFLDASANGVHIGPQHLAGVEGDRINHARLILAGHDPREVLGDMKERNFMENIHNPAGSQVTIDTHMHHGMMGWKRPWSGAGGGAPGLNDSRVYHFMSEAVRGVAQEHNMDPSAAQSTLWYANKDLVGGKQGSPPPQHPRFEEYYNLKPGKQYRNPAE